MQGWWEGFVKTKKVLQDNPLVGRLHRVRRRRFIFVASNIVVERDGRHDALPSARVRRRRRFRVVGLLDEAGIITHVCFEALKSGKWLFYLIRILRITRSISSCGKHFYARTMYACCSFDKGSA